MHPILALLDALELHDAPEGGPGGLSRVVAGLGPALVEEARRAVEADDPAALRSALGELLSLTPRPALTRAQEASARAAALGFDWPDARGPREKLDEELRELDEELARSARGLPARVAEELGDVLLTLVNLGRWHGVDAEEALRGANLRFEQRFAELERRVHARGQAPADLGPEALDEVWRQVKRDGHGGGD